MSRVKVKNSQHVYKRAKERLYLSKIETKRLIKEAQTAGLTYDHLKEGPIKDYIFIKSGNKRVKLYKQYVFVFAKNSTACITMYPLDTSIIEKQQQYDDIICKGSNPA